jgi:hypothetical protein
MCAALNPMAAAFGINSNSVAAAAAAAAAAVFGQPNSSAHSSNMAAFSSGGN